MFAKLSYSELRALNVLSVAKKHTHISLSELSCWNDVRILRIF